MRMRMLRTVPGSVRSNEPTRIFQEGQEYELDVAPGELGAVFLREKWAEEVKAKPAAPENKDLGRSPEDRGYRGRKG